MIKGYRQFKDRIQAKYNSFPTGWAFSEQQLEEQMEKLGVHSKDEILGIGCGGFIRKSDKEEYIALRKWMDDECKAYYENPDNWVEMFEVELADHEFCITGEIEETLDCFGITEEEFYSNTEMVIAMNKAVEHYLSTVE